MKALIASLFAAVFGLAYVAAHASPASTAPLKAVTIVADEDSKDDDSAKKSDDSTQKDEDTNKDQEKDSDKKGE